MSPSRAGRLACGLALLLLASTGAEAATDWADRKGPEAGDPAYAATRRTCARLRRVAVPALARPPADAAPLAKDCSAEDLYYGIGRGADPEAARRCAMGQRAAASGDRALFAGTALLMTMFANGRGAPRDLDVATALACTLDGAPAEMDGRVAHLTQLKADGSTTVEFSICDDVTSGLHQGLCARHDSRIAALARETGFETLAAGWTAADRAALADVRAKAEAFAGLHGADEIDLSGSARAAFEIEAVDAVRDDTLEAVRMLAAGERAGGTGAAPATQDARLDAAYRTVMDAVDFQWGTVTKDGVRMAQRAWLAYRDAFATLASGRGGGAAADEVRAWLTHRRTGQLKAILG